MQKYECDCQGENTYLNIYEDGAETFGERFYLEKERNKPSNESVILPGFILMKSDFSLHK